MNISLVYGDIFFYENAEYVFLGLDGAGLYATKILDIDLSNEIKYQYKKIIRKNDEEKRRLLLYQFTELTTYYYRGRIVTLLKLEGYNIDRVSDSIHKKLNQEDCESLKEDLLESKGTPIKLKKILQG